MAEDNYRMYVRIDGEPFLSKVTSYRAEMKRVREVIWEFARARGATTVPGGVWGLGFPPGQIPDGWKAPDRKGYSKPKKGHPDEALLAALPRLPRSQDVFGDSLCFDLNYKGPEHEGYGAIGYFFEGAYIGWAGDVFFAVIADANRAARDHLAKHPQDKITSGADTWKVPDGLTVLTKAEHDLIVATYEVERERAAKTKNAEAA